jgi:hypothetical protein
MRTAYPLSCVLSVCLVLSVIFSISSSAQQATNYVDAAGKRQGNWMITAAMARLGSPWLPDQMVSEGNFVDSKKDGLWITYFQSGNKSAEISYREGLINGTSKNYNVNGTLASTCEFVNGKQNVIMTTYYPDGKVWTEFMWKDGRIDGPAKTYYPSGKVYEEGYWFACAFIRGYKLYREDGTLIR